jgi:hypothetical protein
MSLEEVIRVVMSMEVDLKAIKERSGAVILESQSTLTHFRMHADDLVNRMTILERKMMVMESSEEQVIQDMRHQIQSMMSDMGKLTEKEKVMNEEVEALKKMRADVETMKDMRGDVETLKAMRAEVDATKAQQELMKEELKTLMTSSSEGAPSSKKAKKS